MSKKRKAVSASQRKGLSKPTLQNRKDLIWLTNKLKRGVVMFKFKNGNSHSAMGTLNPKFIPRQKGSPKENFDLFQNCIRTFYNLKTGKWDKIDVRKISSMKLTY